MIIQYFIYIQKQTNTLQLFLGIVENKPWEAGPSLLGLLELELEISILVFSLQPCSNKINELAYDQIKEEFPSPKENE